MVGETRTIGGGILMDNSEMLISEQWTRLSRGQHRSQKSELLPHHLIAVVIRG